MLSSFYSIVLFEVPVYCDSSLDISVVKGILDDFYFLFLFSTITPSTERIEVYIELGFDESFFRLNFGRLFLT